MPLPTEFTTRMSELLGDEYPAFISGYDAAPLAGLRANTLKISPQALAGLIPDMLSGAVDWCDAGFYTAPDSRPGKSPYYHAGLYYIQEPSAMSPASLMDISPGQRVLDLCAAPGGKSTHLAAKLNGRGVLVANDISATRAKALLKNIELAGVVNCLVTTEPPSRLATRFEGYFDRILVDAPCSGEGMFRKDANARNTWARHKSESCCRLQRESLYFAALMLKPGGRLMYSTCTFAPQENELMIAEFLENNQDFSGVGMAHAKHGLTPGIYGESHTARIWPHRHRGEGHFLAYLQKRGEYRDERTAGRKTAPPELYTEFCRRWLVNAPDGEFTMHGRSLFLTPPGLPVLNGIHLLRNGRYLGDVLTKRFEPSQALAMTLSPADVRQGIDFSPGDDGLNRYLRGESFEISCADGWTLITLQGYPLGWGKAADGRLKNKYLKSWLMN